MTVTTMFIGLAPIMLVNGLGSGAMKRIAAPVFGGLATSFLMELVVYPVLDAIWKSWLRSEDGGGGMMRSGKRVFLPYVRVRLLNARSTSPS